MNLRGRWQQTRVAALAGSVVLAIAMAARAAETDPVAASRLVTDAEQLIEEAGRSRPLDTAKVRTAIDELQKASRLNPRNDGALVDLGFCYGLISEPGLAIESYRSATRVNPSAANFKELADIYLRAGQPEDALMAANAGLTKDPRSAGLYNARGMANLDLKRSDDARRDFAKAIDLDPSLRAAQLNLDALAVGKGSTPGSTVRKHGLDQ